MVDFKIDPKKQDTARELLSGSFSRGNLPSRETAVKFLGEEINGPVLTLGRESSSTLSGRHLDSESQAVANRIAYQASGDSVQRTLVFSGSGVSFAPELNN